MSLFKRNPPSSDIDENDTIDPQLRLRTVHTAASTIAESIRSEIRAHKRRTIANKRSLFFRKNAKKSKTSEPGPSTVQLPEAPSAPQSRIPGARRNIYVNQPLSAMETDHHGEPLALVCAEQRYTLLTFLPKNLFEQFHRIANIYFLALVICQLFSIFGATSPQTAALPLLFILVVTAVKDAVEDYRRAKLDEEVNTSAVTRLGQWRNVNQALDPRPWYQRLLHINAPGKITRGVQKLREKEAGEGKQIILSKSGEDRVSMSTADMNDSIAVLGGSHLPTGAGGRQLEDIEGSVGSVDLHTYPPGLSENELRGWDQHSMSLSNYMQSSPSRSYLGVVDWSRRTNGTARWERTLWKKLEVGDIVLLREDEQVPADIVVLSTSDAGGLCYLETKNLDGETNLKVRKAIQATASLSSEEDIEKSSFVLDSEPPHQNLYVYNGVLRYTDTTTGEPRREGVTINELLLRGCTVRNTAWIIGLVVFTGPDTKIYLNGGQTPSKQSKIAKETNFNVIMNFLFLVIICSVSATINGVMDGLTATSTYIYESGVQPTSSNALNALVTFVSCLIAFQNIVPISLFISIEIVKTIQAYFIAQDLDMYYKPFNTACVPKNWGISDDLGQIEYVFSDKTGTLTQNVMEFQKCSVHGVIYGEGVTEAQRGAATREGQADTVTPEELAEKLAVLKDSMVAKLTKLFKNRYMQVNKLTLVSPKLAEDLGDRSTEQYSHIVAFFRALAVCHSVLADKPEPQERPYHLEYKAESPDEAALVGAARDVGFPFVGKHKDTIDIEVLGQPERFTHIKTLEFTSTRKRMSVIVRASDGRLILYCKGADSVIYERLAANVDPALKEKTTKDMDFFANGGLRTLCIGYRVLAEDEFLRWLRTYEDAQSAIDNRDEAIENAAAEVEHSLQILGATALEDKLQEGVPEAIEMLHRAGIKLWILTGDKLQTAIEIGFSCNLLKQDMEIMILSADTPEGTLAQIEAGLNKIASILGPPTSKTVERGFIVGAKVSFAVVIDGDTLRHALTPDIKPLFLNLGTQCETVVCCRVSPAQKALTVKLVKEGRKAMTLSIGDGANDVAMIQEANVGCGLLGHEGSQAAMSADYAFGQFRFLTKLLLVHGRWSYQRIADMHSNFFYKNVIWTLAMFWFMPFCYFDATYLYDYSFILFYNLIFTSLPVIVLGSFDQDINAKAALAFPQLYVRGIRGLEYTRTKFWFYMLDGLYQSAVVFFIPYLVWQLGLAVASNGKGIDSLADFGTTVAVAAIFAANTYVGMNTHYWTSITWIVVVGSSLVMILWIVIYSFFPVNTFFSNTDGFIDEVEILFSNVTFWTTVVFSVLVALAPRFLTKFFKSTYMPLDKDIIREMWVAGDLKDRLGIRHRKESKNKHVDLETAPMFREPHARSTSELALQHTYEPTFARSPAGSGRRSPDDNGSDTIELVPQATLQNPHDAEDTGSPNPSYYSPSDIPLPSPIPPSLYKYSSGEISSQAPFATPSRSHSLSPEPPVPKLSYSRPSRDWPQSPPRLQTPPHPHSLAHGRQPLVQLQTEGLHDHDPDAGEGRYRPEGSDQENQADSSLAWDEPQVL
ncbi:uncharacterized protein EDB93DRAFT_1274319 [Suillus bovinus]|uniref:uncharacterized protein n=1 Tax=Suillus bovinus TaxID=48563 RepID=UPI001B87F429|nr:uncharacterized protein EDB93DRAFT_1274319 [Suillus bovinus]KAG2151660.1 hypothetical protein EDB93DRAFT_1274319 [Suillus bovinus]